MIDKPHRQPKVSVIIPIYNIESYLPRCLESAANQSLTDIEIICVNDGSTDNSLKVIKKYELNDKRILVIDKKNEGVSSARNAGLDIANGEYVRFLDGDDFLPLDACESLYTYAKSLGSDILINSSCRISIGGKRIGRNLFPDASYHLLNLPERRAVFSKYLSFGTPNQFFRREIIKGIKFKPFSNGEDLLFFAEALTASKIISTMKKINYFHLDRENSASHQKKEVILKIFLQARNEIVKVLEKVENKDQVEDLINRKILSFAIGDFKQLTKIRKISHDFELNFNYWRSCYRDRICGSHKKKYTGENIARLIFKINSVFLYSLLSKTISFYIHLKSNIFEYYFRGRASN